MIGALAIAWGTLVALPLAHRARRMAVSARTVEFRLPLEEARAEGANLIIVERGIYRATVPAGTTQFAVAYRGEIFDAVQKKDDLSWGPNNTFQFPERGGTGAVWEAVADILGRDKISLNTEVIAVDSASTRVRQLSH